ICDVLDCSQREERGMTKGRTPDTMPMQLSLDPRGASRHQQIYDALRAAILSGGLRHGERLPSSRVLARDLGVSRTTVLGAFSRLLGEGLVTGRSGAGTRVAMMTAPLRRGRRALAQVTPGDADDDAPWLSRAGRALFAEGKWRRIPTRAIPFAAGIPALELFPLTTWTRPAARRNRAICRHGSRCAVQGRAGRDRERRTARARLVCATAGWAGRRGVDGVALLRARARSLRSRRSNSHRRARGCGRTRRCARARARTRCTARVRDAIVSVAAWRHDVARAARGASRLGEEIRCVDRGGRLQRRVSLRHYANSRHAGPGYWRSRALHRHVQQ